MKIGLIDVDGHNFPNLCLMKLSAWHKSQGDIVEWWRQEEAEYDIVYMAKVFSSEYSPDMPEPTNAREVIKGGTGYAIKIVDGHERYFKELDPPLPPYIETIYPDYSLYPEYTGWGGAHQQTDRIWLFNTRLSTIMCILPCGSQRRAMQYQSS